MNGANTPASRGGELRVLCVVGGLNPRAGGPTFSTPNIWVALRRAGFLVSGVLPAGRPPSEPEARAIARLRGEGVAIETFPYARGFSKFVRWGVSLPLACGILRAARHCDVVQAHGAWMFSTLVAGVAARLAGRPFVLFPHESLTEHDIRKGSSALRRAAKRLMKRIVLSLADLVVYASPFEQSGSLGQGPKHAAIYHPVYDEREEPPRLRRWPGRIEILRVGFLGRFDPKKNLEILIEAVGQTPKSILKIAGDGPKEYRAALLALAGRSGVAGRVEWLNFIGAGKKDAFFDSIDVLVMPSANEGFGMVAAEALQHGVPVIVSDASGIAEPVGRYGCGVVVPPDAAALAATLESLRRDPARLDELSRRAVQMVQKELSFGAYGAKLAPIYARLAARRGSNAT